MSWNNISSVNMFVPSGGLSLVGSFPEGKNGKVVGLVRLLPWLRAPLHLLGERNIES